jgi:hypothetical protein
MQLHQFSADFYWLCLPACPHRASGGSAAGAWPADCDLGQSDSRSPVVRGDDGKDHVEYELLVVNAVEQPVTLTSLTVLDPAAKELTRIDGPVLVAATQTLLDKKPVAEIPASAAVSVDVDLIVPPGTAPERVTHRLAYSVPAGTSTAVFVDPPVIDGPEVAINRRPATVIKPPLNGGWLARHHRRAAHPTSIGSSSRRSTVAASRPPKRSLSTGPSSRATGSMKGRAATNEQFYAVRSRM